MPTIVLLNNNLMMKACDSLVCIVMFTLPSSFSYLVIWLPAICFARCFQYIVLISFLIHRMSYPLIYSFILLLSLILLSGLLWLPAICFARCFQYIVLISFLIHRMSYPLISSFILLLS